MKSRHPRQRGFTLLEVMMALGLLIGALTVLLLGTGANIQRSHNAYLMGVSADLARGKMFDIEEKVLQDGFQETDVEEEGDFEQEGWPKIKWKYKVEKIELPNLETMGGMAEADKDKEGAEGKLGPDGKPIANRPGATGSSTGGGGVMDTLAAMGGGGASGAQEAGAMAAYFPLFKNLLEQSIRRVTLTVMWKIGKKQEQMVVQMYITDPAGVTRAFLGGIGGAGGTSGTSGGTTGGTTGRTGRTGTTGSGSSGKR